MKNFQSGKLELCQKGSAAEYWYFSPEKINKEFQIVNPKIVKLVEKASLLLGELKSLENLIPDINFFIQMHVTNESTSSSKIEGTQTTIKEALLPEEEINPEKRDDWQEVQNYIQAMNQSIKDLNELPISVRLIKKIHKQILSKGRGRDKLPGETRNSQNWIGGANINSAHFIPPHHHLVADLLTDWEKFWHYQNQLPDLLKIALCHYQFETIHPFLDGNGRVGRLLIILQLIEKKLLNSPILYISVYIEKHKQTYYQALDNTRQTGNIDNWLIFFLNAVVETAINTKTNLMKILELRKKYEEKIYQSKIRGKHKQALELLFTNPIATVDTLSRKLNIDYQQANNLIKSFSKLGILKQLNRQKRNRVFGMVEYLIVFNA